jgi:hypothetical protein
MISRHSLFNNEIVLSERRLFTAMQEFEFGRYERLNIRRATHISPRPQFRPENVRFPLACIRRYDLDSGLAALTLI